MAKSVFRVTLSSVNGKTGTAHWVNFEAPFGSIEEFVAILNDGDILLGENLYTRRSAEDGVLEIIDRKPMALRKTGVSLIETPTLRFVEFEEVGQ